MICKSAKDQLVISNLLKGKYDYCHIQSEGSRPDWSFLPNYKHFIIFYDNDNAGIEGAFKMTNFLCNTHFKTLLSIQCIFLSSVEKDATEYQLKHGKAELFKTLINLL
jgi:DNA primase